MKMNNEKISHFSFLERLRFKMEVAMILAQKTVKTSVLTDVIGYNNNLISCALYIVCIFLFKNAKWIRQELNDNDTLQFCN